MNRASNLLDTVLPATKVDLKQENSERLQSEGAVWSLIRDLGNRLLAIEASITTTH